MCTASLARPVSSVRQGSLPAGLLRHKSSGCSWYVIPGVVEQSLHGGDTALCLAQVWMGAPAVLRCSRTKSPFPLNFGKFFIFRPPETSSEATQRGLPSLSPNRECLFMLNCHPAAQLPMAAEITFVLKAAEYTAFAVLTWHNVVTFVKSTVPYRATCGTAAGCICTAHAHS